MTKHQLNILFFVFNILWVSMLIQDETIKWIALGIASLFFLICMTLGVLFPRYNYFLRSIIRIKNNKVLLTFDDGPNPITTPIILDVLKKHQIGAAFFVIGEKAQKSSEIIKRIVNEEHLIGNHTYSHPILFATLRSDHLAKEIGLCDNVLIEQKINPGQLFRPPIGYTNPRIARATKEFKKTTIGWSLRSYDTIKKDASELLERVLSKTKPNDIVLFHDNLSLTAQILEEYITRSKANGIKFVTKDELKNLFQ